MANHFRLFAAARTVSLGQVLRMVDAEAETTFAPPIWWRLLHKSVLVQLVALHFNLEAAGMTIHTFWRCVAKVGGFPGRKGDGDPGWQTLWQGWSEVLQWYCGALLM